MGNTGLKRFELGAQRIVGDKLLADGRGQVCQLVGQDERLESFEVNRPAGYRFRLSKFEGDPPRERVLLESVPHTFKEQVLLSKLDA